MSEKSRFLMEHIIDADGNFEEYSKIVQENLEDYRTLNSYITARIDKEELAKKIGLKSVRALNTWETKGIPSLQRALQCAIALKLDFNEANEFLSKYAGMRNLYPASRKDFRMLYVLIYRESLEQRFLYLENETVEEWMERIFPQLEFPNRAEELSVEEDSRNQKTTRVSTKTYLDVLMEQNLELIPKIRFRESGERALEYLNELTKNTPFEKNYGNQSTNGYKLENKNERNGSIRKDLFGEEEKGHYQIICNQLKEGSIPHRDVLIQFGMGMTLELGREEIDELLVKSGYAPLSARNLYEGLLLTVFLYEEKSECPEYIDFQVFVSEKIDEALSYLPEVREQLREVPKWYLNESERHKRLEKRYFSEMLVLMSDKMTDTWKKINKQGIEEVSEATLRKAAVNSILELKRNYLDTGTYKKVLAMIKRAEDSWIEAVKNGELKGMKREKYVVFSENILSELDNHYRNTYAPKKKRSAKKGQKGGRKKDE